MHFFRQSFSGVLGFFSSRFAIDLRALAAFRILCGILVAGSCFARLPDAAAFYSDVGLLPVEARLADLTTSDGIRRWEWSLLFLKGAPEWSTVFVGLTGLFACAVALGWRTRICLPLLWICLASLRARNPYAGDGGDALVLVLLFWSLFLPLGTRWSLDSRRVVRQGTAPGAGAIAEGPAGSVFSGGSVSLLLQICLVYWVAAIMKYDPSWRIQGVALAESLSLETLTRPLADWLLQFPKTLGVLTRATLLVEESAPFAALAFPIASRWRCVGPLAVISLHLGIAAIFTLGMFPWIGVAAWLVFLPAPIWNALEHTVKRAGWRTAPRRAGVEEPGTKLLLETPLTYRSCRVRSTRLCCDALPVGLFLLALWWTLGSLPVAGRAIWRPAWVSRTVEALHLGQGWGYFAPRVNTRQGKHYIFGRTRSGREVSLTWNADPVVESTSTTSSPRNPYPNKRWRGLLNAVFHTRKPALIESYADWIGARWEAANPGDPLEQMQIDFLLVDSRHPEDGVVTVQVYPIVEHSPNGRAVFPGDERRGRVRPSSHCQGCLPRPRP